MKKKETGQLLGTIPTGAIYIRVSTDKQEELSPDAQKRLILSYAKTHDIFIDPAYIYIENGISGRKADKRPEFQRMIATAKVKPSPFQVILIWKFSRFARNQEESIVYKSMLKKQCGVEVTSITEPLIDGPFGSLIERIIEWMDEYYSINLSEEVIRGMTEKALRGGYQSTPPLGYRSPGYNQPFVIVPDQAEIVTYIFDQYVNGHRDPTSIARSLNERKLKTRRGGAFEKRNITYILRNRFYLGSIIWRGIEHEGAHETFIAPELFQAANDRLDATFAPKMRRNVSACAHWLSGLVKCSVCGATLGYNRGKYPFFQCWKYAKGMHPCSSGISERILVTGVMEYFERLLAGMDFTFSYHCTPAAEMNDKELYKKELDQIELREIRIRDAYEAGIDTLEEYRNNKNRLQAERERLTNLIEAAPAKDSDADRELVLHNIQNAYDVIRDESVDYETKGVFIRSVVEEIIWDKKNNTLSFHLYLSENP